MRIRPHKHRCADCQQPTECCGDIEQNFDGFPEWICREYHQDSGGTNPDWVCEGCQWKRDDACGS